jgi:hypothetical protein
VDDVDEAAAWRELEAAIGEALWRYAEAVTGVRRKPSAEDAAATAAIELGASYPTIADAADTARQTAWKLYRPR